MTTDQVQREKNIEELMLEAQEAIEPGDLGSTVDLQEGGGIKGGISIESIGWVRVWDTRTGESSDVPGHPDYLRRQLQKTDESTGQRIFTTVKPTLEPFRGTSLCPLHTDSSDAESNKANGFPVCRKSNLRNPSEAERHMRLKHKDTWETMERMRQREIENEERLVRQATITAFTQQAPSAAPSPQPAETEVMICPEPGCPESHLESKSGGMKLKLRWHNKKFHGAE